MYNIKFQKYLRWEFIKENRKVRKQETRTRPRKFLLQKANYDGLLLVYFTLDLLMLFNMCSLSR